MSRDLAHNGEHSIVQVRFPNLVARKIGVNANHLDHVPPKNPQMLFC